MRHICKLYLRACRSWGPGRLTISAWLWKRELEGRGSFLRGVVDDWFLAFRDQVDHCQTCFLREYRANHDAKGR
jgi:hypothetical protein